MYDIQNFFVLYSIKYADNSEVISSLKHQTETNHDINDYVINKKHVNISSYFNLKSNVVAKNSAAVL